jgi:hypothetical protein
MEYESYRTLRLYDKPALEIYNEWKVEQAKRDAMSFPALMGNWVCGLVVFLIADPIIRRLFIFEDTEIWVTSPSGNTTRKLPLPIALRVIRKREWNFTETQPIKPPRIISRREALRILIFGDKYKKGIVLFWLVGR